MTDLRIVDAPELTAAEINDSLKVPTGGYGNYSITMTTIRDWLLNYKMFATQSYVDTKVGVVTTTLNTHTARIDNPHKVTKVQVGLSNVDNTSDINKPVSAATQTALTNLNTSLTAAISVKANSADVDTQLALKANKADVYTKSETYTKRESGDLVNNSISTALTPVNTSLDLAKRGIANRYDSLLTYNSGERVILVNGDIVKSTTDGNTNDPNADMTGWELPQARDVFDASGLSQQEWNNETSKKLFAVTPEMFGAIGDGITDDTYSFNTMLDFINGGPRVYSSNVWKSGSGMLVQLKAGASYLIKETLYIPAWTIIQGTTGLGFNIGSISHKSGLIFDMPADQTAIASNIFRSNGSRYENNLLLVGTDLDSGAVTSAHGIVLKDLSVFAKNQMYCGIKLQGSPQSILDNVYVENFDYCVVGTSSWASKINVKTRHHKCGFLGANSMNACDYDGYLNPMAVATPQTVSNNFLSQTNMFSGTEYDNADVSVGFALYNNGSGVSNKIVSEKSDLAFAFVSSPFSAQLLHSEGSSINSLYVSGYCTVNVDDHTSVGDSSCIHLGVGAKLYQKKSPTSASTSYYKSISSVKTVMALAIEAPYHQRISYNGYNNILYVSPTGDDSLSGIDGQYPLATLDEALKRASKSQTYFNGVTQNTEQVTILITGNGTLSIDTDVDLSRCNINIITIAPQIYPTINVNKKISLRNSKLLLNNMALNISSTGGVVIYGGINHVSMGSVDVVLSGSTLFSLSKEYSGIVSVSGDKSAISGTGLVFDFDVSGSAKWLVKSCYFGGLIGSDVSKYNIPTAFKDGIIT